jgi:hypothetical protein
LTLCALGMMKSASLFGEFVKLTGLSDATDEFGRLERFVDLLGSQKDIGLYSNFGNLIKYLTM